MNRSRNLNRRSNLWVALLAFICVRGRRIGRASAQQQMQKPNILVIMGDDIGYWMSAPYDRGGMGHRTPNIDRIANEGAIFTDFTASDHLQPAAPRLSPDSLHCAPGY